MIDKALELLKSKEFVTVVFKKGSMDNQRVTEVRFREDKAPVVVLWSEEFKTVSVSVEDIVDFKKPEPSFGEKLDKLLETTQRANKSSYESEYNEGWFAGSLNAVALIHSMYKESQK